MLIPIVPSQRTGTSYISAGEAQIGGIRGAPECVLTMGRRSFRQWCEVGSSCVAACWSSESSCEMVWITSAAMDAGNDGLGSGLENSKRRWFDLLGDRLGQLSGLPARYL